MRKILILLSIVLFVGCSSNEPYMDYEINKRKIRISRVLYKHINSFIAKAKMHDIDVRRVGMFEKILYVDLDLIYEGPYADAYGITNAMMKHVLINSRNVDLIDDLFVKLVVYHELAHAVGVPHVKGEGLPHIMREGQYIDSDYLLANWGFKLENEFFKHIKKIQTEWKG